MSKTTISDALAGAWEYALADVQGYALAGAWEYALAGACS